MKFKEVGATADVSAKIQNAESKLSELKTTLSALGTEATAAMMAVESQQQITFEGLLAMVLTYFSQTPTLVSYDFFLILRYLVLLLYSFQDNVFI